ncbi:MULTISPECIES: CU044_5270 family protein [unclassified Streptomyces]|uniref:CU044_5270 family protein n=1 Tax=unclassified Streptomyces TaxID=2593676 RepID=UPI002250BB57|nr:MULTISPECIES: CU044_5270 family protein [unclassified Streptomyces]MCX4987268.1 CU044_5270 family protein [Streptomyces sp. NBC_00568]MCX5007600.1 CU044_5270 family protein [Streptomyces sp. NBC_00638]
MNVDEMKDVREFRAGAPKPDRARLAEGRDRLSSAAGRGRGRRLRADWRLTAVGAAAALTAVAVLASGLGGGGHNGAERTVPAATRTVPGSVKEVLERAASTLERADPPPTPHAGQWVYEKKLSARPGMWPKSAAAQPEPEPEPKERWVRYADPRFENGKEGDDHSMRERLRFLDELPDDPAAVLKKVRAYYPSGKDDPEPGEHDMDGLRVLFASQPVPPQALAKLYRALAAVPGTEVTDHLVRDLAGRDAIAVGHDVKGQKIRREILIDPHTYQYLGDRWIVVKDYKDSFPSGSDTPERPWKAGDLIFQNALLATGIVDHKGDRP